jgi:hypothetical protein
MMRMGVGLPAILAPLQLVIGDLHGLNTLEASADQDRGHGGALGRQQARRFPHHRLAGREGEREKSLRHFDPAGSSLILTHDPNGLFPGLKDVPPSDRPPVPIVFFAFRIMVGDRLLHDRGGLGRRVAVVARPAVRNELVSAHRPMSHVVDRFRRGDCGLGGHRKRTPAVARARHPAHRRRVSPVPAAVCSTTLRCS